MRFKSFKMIRCAMVIALIGVIALGAQAAAAPPFKVKATISGETPLRGKAIFQEKNNHQGPYRLDVHVNQGVPLQTLDVTIDGVFIGQITTNPGGSGRLRLKNIAEPLNPGSVIEVGPSSGVFGTPENH